MRFYNRTRQQYPNNPVSLYFADQGHMRGQNKDADTDRIEQAQQQWLDYYVLGEGRKPRFSARALTQTCGEKPSAGPFQGEELGEAVARRGPDAPRAEKGCRRHGQSIPRAHNSTRSAARGRARRLPATMSRARPATA